MTSTERPRYTLLIPTYNRPGHLRSLLGYLAARQFRHPIKILDSSSTDAVSQNRETIAKVGLDIVYQTHESTIPAAVKFALGPQSVETTYCSFCPDDDILFTNHVDEILDLLDANPGAAAAHGNYINIKPGQTFDISDVFYWAPSIAADNALKRIVEQMSNYQAIFYAIHRTSVMKSVQSQLPRMQSGLAHELLSSSLTLIAGAVYRLPHVYMARNTEPSNPSQGWHPYHFLSDKPDSLFREYAAYRAVVLEQLLADEQCRSLYKPEQMEKILDLVHLKYLTPMMSPPIIDYILAESMRPERTPGEILMGIRDTFENTPEGQSIRKVLRSLRQVVLQPRHGRKILRDAIQLFRIFRALRTRENLKVRGSPSLRRISVDRIRRDGRSRRYVLFHEFLQRELAGGRRMTAAETNSILEQLDDYV